MRKTEDPVVRFRSFCVPEDGGCIGWIGQKSNGYGRFWFGGRLWKAHRWEYERIFGPLKDGFTLDHLCRNRGCVNVSHLELVTPKENILRGAGETAKHAKKTHCCHGHLFDGNNLIIRTDSKGRKSRKCRICKQACDARRRIRISREVGK